MTLDDFLAQPNRDLSIPYLRLNGDQLWFDLEGKYPRDNDLPAIVYANGTKEWLNPEGWLHRTTGPAAITSDGEEYHFLEGKYYSYETWLEARKPYLPVPPPRFERQPLI